MNSISNYLYRRFIIFLFTLPIFIIFGFMNLSIKLFPTVVEIKHFGNKTQATIGNKFIFSNSVKHSLLIPNVKEAKMISSIGDYKIVLVGRDGENYSVTSSFSSPKDESKQLLLKRLNTAIKSNVNFTFEIIDKKAVILSTLCIIIPSLILYFWILYIIKHPTKPKRILNRKKPNRKPDEEDEIAELRNYPVSEVELERQALESPNPAEEPKKNDDEQYKDINNSIIK